MDFLQLIHATGGIESFKRVSDSLQIDQGVLFGLIDASSAHLTKALRRKTTDIGGRTHLQELVSRGGPQQYIDNANLVTASICRQEGERLLVWLFPDPNDIRQLNSELASSAQLPVKAVNHALPLLTCLFVGAICKKVSTPNATNPMH